MNVFLQAYATPPEQIVLDLDATDDPIHGHQLGRFFHGYYDCYCYLPLYIFCGEHLLAAKLRPADIDGAAGAVKTAGGSSSGFAAWPQVIIVLRGDSGFCREPLMAWCETNGVDYLLGLARNARLWRIIGEELQEAKLQYASHRRSRPGSSRSSSIRRGRVGPARVGWWPRPSTWPRAPIRASW